MLAPVPGGGPSGHLPPCVSLSCLCAAALISDPAGSVRPQGMGVGRGSRRLR